MGIQEVYEAKIVRQDDNYALIEWSADIGFGQLTIEYDGSGGYKVDAEFLSIECVIKIIKAL